MKQALLARRVAQIKSNVSRERGIIAINENLLPDLTDPEKNWATSATHQWNLDDMGWIKDTPALQLVEDLGESIYDPWLVMGVTAELILHDDDERARAFAQKIISMHPDAKSGLTRFFGDVLLDQLLTSAQVS